MIFVDTTVWVDFFRGRHTKQVQCLEATIQQNNTIFYCGLVLTELLQGIPNKKQSQQLKSHFDSLLYIEMLEADYVTAAEIYVTLRQKGVTVRKTIDCLIAALAISHQLPLLHSDKDFLPIAKYCGLRCVI